MLDIKFRALKDSLFDPISHAIPPFISPLQITFTAFLSGLTSCFLATTNHNTSSLLFWLLNRALDCLDGAVARQRNQSSNLGGFLDLLGDFIVYSLIPICTGMSREAEEGAVWHLWLAISVLEASFHINNFVLFFVAAVLEKMRAGALMREGDVTAKKAKRDDVKVRELTSVAMKPALVEGMESGIIFTVMLARPAWTEALCWTMAVLVGVGIMQRVIWLVPVLD